MSVLYSVECGRIKLMNYYLYYKMKQTKETKGSRNLGSSKHQANPALKSQPAGWTQYPKAPVINPMSLADVWKTDSSQHSQICIWSIQLINKKELGCVSLFFFFWWFRSKESEDRHRSHMESWSDVCLLWPLLTHDLHSTLSSEQGFLGTQASILMSLSRPHVSNGTINFVNLS